MFAGPSDSYKDSFLEQTKAAREERALEKKKEAAAIKIQARIKGFLARRNYRNRIIHDVDQFICGKTDSGEIEIKLASKAYPIIRRFLSKFSVNDSDEQKQRFQSICRSINKSTESESIKVSYAGLSIQKEFSLFWIDHIKTILRFCCLLIKDIRPENHADSIVLALYLHTLIIFTSPKPWGIWRNKNFVIMQPVLLKICHNIQGYLVKINFFEAMRAVLIRGTARELTLKPVSLNAIMTLCTRPLIDGEFSHVVISHFFTEILSVPALIHILEEHAPQCISQLQSMKMLQRAQVISEDSTWFEQYGDRLPGTKALAFLGNLINLFYIETPSEAQLVAYPSLVITITILLKAIPKTSSSKCMCIQWHDVLGWHQPSGELAHNQNVTIIKKQLHMLWGHRCIKYLFGNNLKELNFDFEGMELKFSQKASGANIIRRALERSSSRMYSSKHGKSWRKMDAPEVIRISRTCEMFYAAMNTLSQIKLDILSSVCFIDNNLPNLWLLIKSLGPQCGKQEFLGLLKLELVCQTPQPQIAMLMLFCDCMTYYVTILDEQEMYVDQVNFKLNEYILMTFFLNNFLFKLINENVLDNKQVTQSPFFASLYVLLLCLYRRDCRRKFAPENHWLIPEIKPANLFNDLEKGKRHAEILLQKMPHIIPHEDRVKLFRKFVQNEKAVMGLTESACTSPRSALIVIHRERIVEDGYSQLAALRVPALKGVIRVRFINQQGLHEAGIDQDGVFKEFLEETIKRVFDPSLNLFKTTTDQRLYPSPLSYVQDNHLQLFEFIGRMLGKAVYEGIVVDVPFASFFLSQLLGQTQQALYSCIDELPSLDSELYKNLTFLKHYQGDVSDLNLTFSVDQDVMGKLVSNELHPGGKARAVTESNKLVYIHYMAYFHMNTQIREQTLAFNRGFRSIVNPEWLSLFSPPELQRLISGDTAPLNLDDLRKHTQYYGGFHDSHRVVGWLWDILAKDFTEEEKKLFLKFVTSCSQPPLLGFAYLEPPFSIRCVEVGDDEDTGDTIGSVVRGFFTIRKKDPLNRLPTSSTCFNLLKLPNYRKRSTLRDKLRYAISSNTGFELS